MITGFWGYISAAVAIIVLLIIAALAAIVIVNLFTGKIDLRYLLAEPVDPATASHEEPKASLSRFQFLIFTFVIVGVYLVLCLEYGRMPDIPANVVLLLGVSSATYAASKGIKAASDSSARQSLAETGVAPPVAPVAPPPPPAS